MNPPPKTYGEQGRHICARTCTRICYQHRLSRCGGNSIMRKTSTCQYQSQNTSLTFHKFCTCTISGTENSLY